MHWNSVKCLNGGMSRGNINTDKIILLTKYIFFLNVGFVAYASDEHAASIFTVDHKERGRIMIEDFEDKPVINFRVAGYVNKDALSN